MEVKHFLYGDLDITEPVLVDIINSPYMQRLKKISNGGFYPGGFDLWQKDSNLSRYTHSIGVLILLKMFEASIEEQIAGLIHDISHSAFSHTIDYINKNNKEAQKSHSTQDEKHEDFISNTDIPEILEKYGFDLGYILDDSNFTLKETPSPDLCADRIDACLREGFIWNHLSREDIDTILKGLINYQGEFVFKDKLAAETFAEAYWEIDKFEYSGLKTAIMFCYSGELLAEMLDKEYITMDDLYQKTDKDIIKEFEIYAVKDKDIKNYLKILNKPASDFKIENFSYSKHVICKVRKVNPKILLKNNSIINYSDISPVFAQKFKNRRKFNEYYLSLR